MKRFDLTNAFAVDLRSLAVFRLALGATLLCEISQRSLDLVAHYTDLGVLPAESALRLSGRGMELSPHYWASPWPLLEGLLFLIAAVAAISLILGYRTRVVTALSWFLLVSVQVRNPWISTAGYDKLLRLLLFWALFLPLGARYSLDDRRSPRAYECSNRLADIPGAALLIQVALVYWVTSLKKTGASWSEGTAIYHALHQDLYVSAAGVWLREFPEFLRFGTHATRWLELLGPVIAFSPWFAAPLRGVAVVSFIGFHVTLGLFLNIGMFPLVASTAWLPFIPGAFWDALERRRSGAAEPPGASESAPYRIPRWVRWSCASALVYVLAFLGLQLFGGGIGGVKLIPGSISTIGRIARIDQHWAMFAPDVPAYDRWLVFEGTLANGDEIDILSGREVQLGTPDPTLSSYLGIRWRLWMLSLLRMKLDPAKANDVRIYRANSLYLCKAWNADHAPPRRATRVRTIRIENDLKRRSTRDDVLNVTMCP